MCGSLAGLILVLQLTRFAPADSWAPLSNGWSRYTNERFGTVFEVPLRIFDVAEPASDNGDGVKFRTENGSRLMVYGTYAPLHAKPRAAWSADRAADRSDATHQPPAHAAARRRACRRGARGVHRDNPKHQRSKLVRLTAQGKARYRELNSRFLSIASILSAALNEAEIRRTAEIVWQLSNDVKAGSGE
jgi:hypothetical protein